MNKTKIISLSYNAMFKAVFGNNKYMLSLLVQSILDYCKLNINVMDKELIVKNNELSISNANDKQLVCDYLIKVNEDMDLNIEVNRSHYPGLEERNLCYSFKIYCDHFKSGDDYDVFKKYFLVQVNFNNFSNPGKEEIKDFYLLDIKDPKNFLTKNICILNVDIASCRDKFYNKDKLREMSILEKFGTILKAEYLEDISNVLRSMRNMSKNEKDNFLKQVVDMSKDKDIQDAIKLEDNIEYRFKLVEEDALERGISQGIEQNTIDIIKEMLKNNATLEFVSTVTGKSIQEIKEIENSIKE